jgi:hypothetical protein
MPILGLPTPSEMLVKAQLVSRPELPAAGLRLETEARLVHADDHNVRRAQLVTAGKRRQLACGQAHFTVAGSLSIWQQR